MVLRFTDCILERFMTVVRKRQLLLLIQWLLRSVLLPVVVIPVEAVGLVGDPAVGDGNNSRISDKNMPFVYSLCRKRIKGLYLYHSYFIKR